ncbi:ferredoxin--NADP reductase [Deinococcus sp. YIM 77859]|uniref:ferredoxin--NADP reductase n=1 Tax=Deinococcus sp. YIM 77859 TaxID=1540221 RepID=UPI0012E07CB9|nr:hypothetical protein [Deinococcus sp. YIM 77859]
MLSMASSPTRPYLEFAVRMSGSSFKRTFQQLQVGDEVLISGPAGSFVIDPAEHLVLLSGGVGITPLKSIAEYAADLRLPMRLTLLYSNRDTSEMAYAQALAELAGRNPLFRVIHTLTREPGTCWSGQRGRVDAALIQQHVVDLDRAVFFLCGPPGLVRGLHATLNELGVTDERIRSEDFTGY